MIRINMGEFIKYYPKGIVKIKFVGFQSKSQEQIFTDYRNVCESVSLFSEIEVEETELYYFLDSIRTHRSKVVLEYFEVKEDQVGELAIDEDLMNLARELCFFVCRPGLKGFRE